MLSRLVCRRNRGANGSKNAASSGSASGEALGTLLIFILHSTTETNKVVLGAGEVGWVPSALKIAPCAGQLNCPVDALYLTATPAWVQACSTATKLPLLIWTSQLAWPSAGLVKLTALFVAWFVCPITVPVGVGVIVGDEVGDGCGVFVGEGEGRGVGCGVGFLCGRFPLPSPSPLSLPSSPSLCPSIEVDPSDPSSSVRDGACVGL